MGGSRKNTPLTGSSGSINIGDPFSIANGQSHEAFLEAILPTGNRTLNFVRYFVSHFDVWTYYPTLRAVPKPYGSDPQNQHAARWWHSLLSVVRIRYSTQWLLLDTSGHQYSFASCTIPSGSSSCFAGNDGYSFSLRSRLERTATGFVFHEDDALRYVYEAHHVHEATSFYFLSRIEDYAGNTLLTLTYAQPPGISCPTGEAGSTAGVPYISTATTNSGTQLLFSYKALSRTSSVTECVLDSIDIQAPGTSAQRLVSYAYTQSGGVERPGLLASASSPSRGAGQPQRVETYDYTATQFRVSRDGKTVAQHDYENTYYARVTSTQGPGESLSVSWGARGTCQPGSNCCGSTPYVRDVVTQTAGRGDGLSTAAGFTRSYEILPMATAFTFHEARTYRTVDSCTVPQSCSPGSVQYEWDCTDSSRTFPGFEKGIKDKRGNWTANIFTAATGSRPKALTEKSAVLVGATDVNGSNALQRTDFAYTYGYNFLQLPSHKQQTSVIASPSDENPYSRIQYVYESSTTAPPNRDRLKATLWSGWTKDFKSTGWDKVPKTIATFTFTARTVGDTTPDPLGRVVEEHGPCYVATSGTPTDCEAGKDFPITRYFYWPHNAGTAAAGHMQKIVRYPSQAPGTTPLETKFNTYDVWGNPTQIENPDGTLTNNTWVENRLISSQVGSQPAIQFGYLDDRLSYVKHRATDSYEVYCYRTGVSSTSCSGTLTPNLQWRARAPNSDGTGWTERVEYAYWPDGTLKEARHVAMNGTVAETRFVMSYAADAHKRPVLEKWGEGSGSFSASAAYDGADNLTAIGHAFNAPPAWCGGVSDVSSGTPLSDLCNHPSYDRANRLESLLQYPGGSSAATKTLFARDAQGNITGIKSGCAASDSYSTCTQPASTYVYDDFHRLVEVTPAQATGTLRLAYDAQGNRILRETAAMRALGERVEYTYDNLSRLKLVEKVSGSLRTALYRLGYDDTGAPPSGCGTGLDLSTASSRSLGRLRYKQDSFGFTWYRYDEEGRVTAEVRARDGSCGGNANNNPHTLYAYTADGGLERVTYPYGRQVHYLYGSGANSHRVTGIEVTLHDGTSWGTPRTLLSDIRWEPFGGLRSYRLLHDNGSSSASVDYAVGGDASASSGGCSSSPPSSGTGYDLTGRLRSLRVTSSAASTGAGDIFQRNYQWAADQVLRTDTCVLGGTARTETFTYDRLLRLTGRQLTGAQSGTSLDTSYGYDSRSNRSSSSEDGFPSTSTLASSGAADWLSSLTSQTDASLQSRYAYDSDGRALQKAQGKWMTGADASLLEFFYGQDTSVATDTVFRAVRVNGASYNYFYDAEGRRRAKGYENGNKDEFFYDGAKHLLVDQGNGSNASGAAYLVTDDYVWLGDRAVAVVRGRLSSSWARQSDASTTCDRHGEATACGIRFFVTDHIAKAALTLDSQLRVTDVTDHDAFGLPNHVSLHASTAHPYPNGLSSTLADFTQVAGSSSLTVQARVLFHLVDTESLSGGGAEDDTVHVKDGDTGTTLASFTGHLGRKTTAWLQPSAGRIAVAFTSGPNSNPSHAGAIIEGYEYRRFQSGAQPFASPLRFPGQYYDAETGLFENWNRFYDPHIGRYLQREPLLSRPEYTAAMAAHGYGTPTYAYAANNPQFFFDSDGFYFRNYGYMAVAVKPERGNWFILPPLMEYPGQIDGWFHLNGRMMKVVGKDKSWLGGFGGCLESNVEINPDKSYGCRSGICLIYEFTPSPENEQDWTVPEHFSEPPIPLVRAPDWRPYENNSPRRNWQQ
ncbi:RHS repeat-associated core domain-containing protein [Myxococcus stipitatus]|uniref:RHS repeat-associated core domain-containing protein n=1 Tax=Myxococcus stipitatus TaxID=83455 RepID=UPI002278DC1F|nr:RHS repeat-associated core domain-containing protein [Myxococcus stipitatus]